MNSYRLSPPQNIDTSIQLSTSKSVCNRALIIAALCKTKVSVNNISDSDDTKALQASLDNDTAIYDIGAAGTAMRFLTAFLSQKEGQWQITGSERMKKRPIGILVDALRQLGADISYLEEEGYPPLLINGKTLTGGQLTLNSNISSQFISAILMISPTLKGGLKITLDGDIISRPYIQMTLDLMAYFGVETSWINNTITIPEASYHADFFDVEIDWSGASYWYEIVAFSKTAKVLLRKAKQVSYQGDAEVMKIYKQLGVNTTFTQEGAILSHDDNISSLLEYDLINQPDLAQTVVTTCAILGVHFKISGLQTLRIKETDRIAALIKELSKYGIVIYETQSGTLEWHGENCAIDETIKIATYDDHRMALAFAPTAIVHPGVIIKDPEVVTKSYPGFWKDLKTAGFEIEEVK